MATSTYHLDEKDKTHIPRLKKSLESAGNKVTVQKTTSGYSVKVTKIR